MPNDKNQQGNQQQQGSQKRGQEQQGGSYKQGNPRQDQGGMNQPNQTGTPQRQNRTDDEDEDT